MELDEENELLMAALDDYSDDCMAQALDEYEEDHPPQEGGRFRFQPEPIHDRVSRRFGVQERVVRLRPVQDGRPIPNNRLVRTLTRGMQNAISRVLRQMNIPDNERFYVSLTSDRLRSASNAFHVTAGEWRQNQLRANALLQNLSNMLNNNENFQMDDSFNLSVVHVRPAPRGSGRKRKYVPGHQSNVRLKQMKRTVVEMPRDEQGWCAARAIVTARGLHEAGSDYNERRKWTQPNRCYHRRRRAAEELAQAASLTPGEWGPPELTQVARQLLDYTLVVIDASRAYSATAYGRGPNRLGLLYDQGHYDTLTSVEGFLGQAYFCNHCLKPYSIEGRHRCTANKINHCSSCRQSNCQEYRTAYQLYKSPDLYCDQCHRRFYGNTCLQNHLTHTIQGKPMCHETGHLPVCQTVRQCQTCKAYLSTPKEIKRHRCGHAHCKACKEYVEMAPHKCFIQVLSNERDENYQAPLHIFFDIEAKQEETRHVPNLLVCLREDERTFYKWWGDDCVEKFLLQLETWCQQGEQPLIVLAHNFQGYDSYPVIDKLHEMRVALSQIRNGGKVLQLSCFDKAVRFIDSMSFFSMKLSKFPKTFGLTELKKGYFPHLFNIEANQHYVGPLPAAHYYMPENMSLEDRAEFDKWHAQLTSENYVFDFRTELLQYCNSDVLLLKEGCLTFKREFEALAGFNPFDQMTIASACSRYLRTHCLQPQTIACEPLLGWSGRRTNQSTAALEWLGWEGRTATIQHGQNGGEFRPLPDRNYLVDGYDESTRTLYEFDGCFWHGCPTCFPVRHEPHHRLLDRTMDDVYRLRNEKHDALRNHGYQLKSIWECQWQRKKQTDPAIQSFLQTHIVPRALNPRDAFFGGRTNAYQLYYHVKEGETIHYYDYKSLYPYVNKYCRYPVGHPEIIDQPDIHDVIAGKYFGLVHCTVVPPKQLLHPVLPYRSGGKLTFPLCATCVQHHIDDDLHNKHIHQCQHGDAQRQLTGTWCTPELDKALEKGYRLVHAYQIYHFKDSQVGLFGDYINTWLKLKEEASGYPPHVKTGHEQRQHMQRWSVRENIGLRHQNMQKNPGRRYLAKQMLNSMWGKFGQQTNKTQVQEFLEPPEFWQFLDSSTHDIHWVSPLSEERVEVHYKMQDQCESDSPNLNIFIACFTTCWARLHLYQMLDLLGDRVLYSDTDSIIFLRRMGDPTDVPALGDFLGDFTDELDTGDYIIEFCAGGPKNYGYLTHRGVRECKVRGFSLNVEGSQQLNYDVLRQNTLDELEQPLDNPRVIPITQTHAIHRNAKEYQLTSGPKIKQYRLVYNKRILDPDTYYTYPYGWQE